MTNEVENPWKGIEQSNIFFDGDKDIINKFNEKLKIKGADKLEDHDYYIHPDLLPEPYMGNPDANVILLFANPGFGGKEKDDYKATGLREKIFNNLTHSNLDHPYYYLNPELYDSTSKGQPKFTEGAKWARRRMSELFDKIKAEELSQKIFTLQLHPYHSARFKKLNDSFKGYNYTMSLFENAIERAEKKNALIVCARSYKHWNEEYKKIKKNQELDMMKDLGDNFMKMLYPRTTYFSPKHFGEEEIGNNNFNKLIEYLKKTVKSSH